MSNLTQVIDDIRLLLSTGDLSKSNKMESLSRQLADESRPVLIRLKQVDQDLQKGLRSEALQFARTEPDLLELIGLLSFPERGIWDDALVLYGLDISPRPSEDTASALNLAYSQEEPLKPLLIQYRLLALARAPLMERLEVVRKMFQYDPNNIAFQEDLGLLEEWRLTTFRHDMDAAKKIKDHHKILALWDEIDSGSWVNAPPPLIVEELRKLADEANRAITLDNLKSGLIRIRAAANTRDEDAMRKYLDSHREYCLYLGLEKVHSLHSPLEILQTEKILKEMDDKRMLQFEFEAACGDLEGVLIKKMVQEEDILSALNKLEIVVKQLKKHTNLVEIPSLLTKKSDDRLKKILWEKNKKEYIILGVSLALGTVCLLTFVLVIINRGR